MKRKHKHTHKKLSIFVFTPAGIALTQEAMQLYEQVLQQSTGEPAKIAFAKETMLMVNGKLDSMSKSVGDLCLTSFDYNEKLVIATALQLYSIDLLATPATARRERKLKLCQQVQRFAQDNLKVKQMGTVQD
jgi:hypothetical protein